MNSEAEPSTIITVTDDNGSFKEIWAFDKIV